MIFHGTREDLTQVLDQIGAFFKELPEAESQRYQPLLEQATTELAAHPEVEADALCTVTLQSRQESLSARCEEMMKRIKQALPQVQMAVLAQYKQEDAIRYHPCYFPSGSDVVTIDASQEPQPFPNEDWIPLFWRRPGQAPFAKAEGTITLLGAWGDEEKAALQRVLLDPALMKSLGYVSQDAHQPAIYPIENPTNPTETGGYAFALMGGNDLSTCLANLDLMLCEYLWRRRTRYAAFCQSLREKQLLILVDCNSHTNPTRYGEYQHDSASQFLLSSNGQLLRPCLVTGNALSLHLDDGTAVLSTQLAVVVYYLITQRELGNLNKEGQFLVQRALCNFIEKFSFTQFFQERAQAARIKWGEDATDINEAIRIYTDVHRIALIDVIQKAITMAEALCQQTGSPRLALSAKIKEEAKADRLANQRFYIKGDFEDNSVEDIKQLVQRFGGKVANRASAADYFIYGSNIGKPFATGLKSNVAFLSLEYFEDMLH